MTEGPIQIQSRYEPIQPTIDVLISIKRDNTWYQMNPFNCSHGRAVAIVERLKKRGCEVEFTWFEGMGLNKETPDV